jgi:predicted NACHT family NTPase
VGTGGLGKSMMMRHLLLDAIENYDDRKRVPIFVELRHFGKDVDSLFEYACARLSVFDGSLTREHFRQMLDNGACILLLDGLDEISTDNMGLFERELEKFIDQYSGNTFVLSSRPFQSFQAYERFGLFWLEPFSLRQALLMIDKLELPPEESPIKADFKSALEKKLYRTHRSFARNPLLLTIMFMTFEEYSEVPTKMHVFYREAFDVLARRHDASKVSYRRSLKTGLSVDAMADYFSELCFRSYNDERYEMTAEQFAGYYNKLKARADAADTTTTARDFLDDLCAGLCLMREEGSNSYHFTHRSFQEYFCALFLSKLKDKDIQKLGGFFEKHGRRMRGEGTFRMLHDMATEKVEEFILLPFLSDLFEKCDREDKYFTFWRRCIQG